MSAPAMGFVIWEGECDRGISRWMNEEAGCQTMITEADKSDNVEALIRLHDEYRPDDNKDPFSIRQYFPTRAEKDKAKIAEINSEARRGKGDAEEDATTREAEQTTLEQQFKDLGIPALEQQSEKWRKEAEKEVKGHNDYLAKVAARKGDPRKVDNWETNFQDHKADLSRTKGGSAATDFETLRKSQNGGRRRAMEEVRKRRTRVREDAIVDSISRNLYYNEQARVALDQAPAILKEKEAQTGQLKKWIAQSEDRQVEVDKILETLVASLSVNQDKHRGLEALELTFIAEREDGMNMMCKALEAVQAAARVLNNAFLKRQVAKKLLAKLKATIDDETMRLKQAREAAAPASEAISLWKKTATEKADALDERVATSVTDDIEKMRPVLEKEALNIQLARALLKKAKDTQREEMETLEEDKRKLLKESSDLDGSSGLDTEDRIAEIQDEMTELDMRIASCEMRRQATGAADAEALAQWDALESLARQLDEDGQLIDEARAANAAEELASKCYDDFASLHSSGAAAGPRASLQLAKESQAGAMGPSSSTALAVQGDQSERDRMMQMIISLQGQVAELRLSTEHAGQAEGGADGTTPATFLLPPGLTQALRPAAVAADGSSVALDDAISLGSWSDAGAMSATPQAQQSGSRSSSISTSATAGEAACSKSAKK
eukprot:TRINITY_DN81046_c0_g1_i1.p1 TRINITY_DN81046_c0_g1~~TRINITY_DN81046_c0_g1_i1.p1  ORF type:complete len:700 (+),score=254.00 TRINITY_DN81046_c0_g1_i1:99-2102(+)